MSQPVLARAPREIPVFDRGRRLFLGGLAAGALGMAGVAVGILVEPRQTMFSYLTAFAYCLSLALGALAWTLAFQASNSHWIVVVRRFLEVQAANVPLFALLFIPIVIGMKHLYPWIAPDPARGAHFIELMKHKEKYLNIPFFLIRAAFFFAYWGVVGNLLLSWSRKQDQTRSLFLTVRMRRLGAGALPLFGLTLTFAAFDWLMGLDPEWYSTIFGVYYFAGGFVAAMAVLIITVTLCDRAGLLPGLVTRSHYHSMGKLLFAFLCFWASIGFSQLLIIWIANKPDEIGYFKMRFDQGYRPVFYFIILLHFVAPFLILLSKKLKQKPVLLSIMAAWVLVVHWVDLYWMVMPYKGPGFLVHWQDAAALLGTGGFAVALSVYRLRGSMPAPVGDPYFEESTRYSK